MAVIKNYYQDNFSGPLHYTFTTTLGGAAQNLPLFGGAPDEFWAINRTQVTTPTDTKITGFYWQSSMPSGSAYLTKYNGTLLELKTFTATDGVTPFQTSDQLKWVPNQAPYITNKSTALVITGISKAAQAVVTATHSFTTADNNVTWVTFSQVVGMTQINTLRGQVVSSTSTTSFVVNIDTTNFTTYGSGGQANVISGAPATTQFGPQIIMTPQRDLGLSGITLGTALMQNTADVWDFVAVYNGQQNG